MIAPLILDGGMLVVSTFSPEGAHGPLRAGRALRISTASTSPVASRAARSEREAGDDDRPPRSNRARRAAWRRCTNRQTRARSGPQHRPPPTLDDDAVRIRSTGSGRQAGRCSRERRAPACTPGLRVDGYGGADRDELRRPDAAAVLAADAMNVARAGVPQGFTLMELIVAMVIIGDADGDRAAQLHRVRRPQSKRVEARGRTARGERTGWNAGAPSAAATTIPANAGNPPPSSPWRSGSARRAPRTTRSRSPPPTRPRTR